MVMIMMMTMVMMMMMMMMMVMMMMMIMMMMMVMMISGVDAKSNHPLGVYNCILHNTSVFC